MYFIEGLANGRIAVLGKIHHALADGVASANLCLLRGMDPPYGPGGRSRLVRNRSRARGVELIRSAFADHMRPDRPAARRDALHRAGREPGAQEFEELSPELTRPFTRRGRL